MAVDRSTASRRGARLAVALLVAAAALVVPVTATEAVTRPTTLYHERPVTAAPVEPGFPIDYVGVAFQVPSGSDAGHAHGPGEEHPGAESLAVRFRKGGEWGSWVAVGEDGAQGLGQWTGALVAGGDAEAYQVRGVPTFARGARAAALNTTDGPAVTVGHRTAGAANAVARCKSRKDWGADETLRTGGRDFAPLQVMTVHHTATENNDPDPDARVRAIYSYHVKTNGWADIGYQALISEDGTVYEGRWSGKDSPSCVTGGGTGWEFGHQSNEASSPVVTGAHVGGYNTGNFGVSLLGTFTSVAPTTAARDSLVSYLAELSKRHGIDPEAQVLYVNPTNSKTVNTISGHRDYGSTECPGGVLYADLPAIRTATKTQMSTPGATNTAPVVTITSPANADSYTVKETAAGAGATVTLAATATDDAPTSELSWSWTDGTGVRATTASFTTTLQVGSHTFRATATDAGGLSRSDSITVTVTPPYVDDVATGETTTAGTRTGSYVDTTTAGGSVEAIKEVESGGKANRRYSLLNHRWTVPVTGGSAVTLFVRATATASGDGDGFQFAYSSDGGQTYAPLLVVPAGRDATFSAPLPGGTSGQVLVRVTDTNRTAGSRSLDSITVDHLYIRSE